MSVCVSLFVFVCDNMYCVSVVLVLIEVGLFICVCFTVSLVSVNVYLCSFVLVGPLRFWNFKFLLR